MLMWNVFSTSALHYTTIRVIVRINIFRIILCFKEYNKKFQFNFSQLHVIILEENNRQFLRILKINPFYKLLFLKVFMSESLDCFSRLRDSLQNVFQI